VTFDLRGLLANQAALLMLPIFVVLLLVIRGLPALLAAPVGASGKDRISIVLFAATGLPIIVAVSNIGVDSGYLPQWISTALVGAGMLSVLIFPTTALLIRGFTSSRKPDPGARVHPH
jgi:hypothetical protein